MRRVAELLVALGFALALGASGACGGTGGDRFAFAARAGGVEGGGEPFVNEKGWAVRLSRADVTIGPVYLNVEPPLRSSLDWLVKTAYAGEAHLGGGRIVGEVLARVTFDARSSALVDFPATGSATAEAVRTAEVWLWPPGDVPAERVDVESPTLDVAGEAVRGAERVAFRGRLVLDGAWVTSEPGDRSAVAITELRKARGIPAAFFPSPGGWLEVRVDVRALFRAADFALLSANPRDEAGVTTLVQAASGPVTTDQVMRNIFQGLRAATGTYRVQWNP